MPKFFVTTAIDYVNSEAHVGHSYQKIIADVLARWHKLKGEKVWFLTGTDEHGQKIAKSAQAAGMKEKEFVDAMSQKFKEAWQKLNIKYDRFIRTTDKDHEEFVKGFTEKINKKGDIYKGTYSGLYCTNCEAYYTEKDLVNGCCPIHKTKIEVLSEETYYFKMSKYQNALLKLFDEHPEFILPAERRNEIRNRVKEGLRDLSITRSSISWGIPFPMDNKHIIYVWYEALLNYLSGAGKKQEFWPADLHLLGKDNGWFHGVIWPAMLMSAGYELPKTVFIHGFLTFNGEKISKSLGNVISPNYLADKYGADALRYFLLREIPFGQDGNFSEEALKERLNNELANELGNLVNRAIVLIEKKLGGKIPAGKTDSALQKKLLLEKIEKHMKELELHHAVAEIFSFVSACNQFVNEKEPWKLEGKELDAVLYSLADSIRIISILLQPFMPATSEKINEQIGVKAALLKDCKFNLLKAGTKTKRAEILFRKL